jgi:uncharacterized membrane protein YecN with MAPEG domain
MILPITLTIAAAAALINIWLGIRISQVRRAAQISHGDGGHPLLTARMRAHANFVEYTPFVLILLGLIEHGTGSPLWLWAVGIVYIIGRLAHPFGMATKKPGIGRIAGIAITLAVLAGLSGYAIYLAYQAPVATGLQVRR